jgi:hypothetical protein
MKGAGMAATKTAILALAALVALAAMAALPARAQSAFQYRLDKVGANKVVLLDGRGTRAMDEWMAMVGSDAALHMELLDGRGPQGDKGDRRIDEWRRVIDSDAIHGYGFVLLNGGGFLLGDSPNHGIYGLSAFEISPDTFGAWLGRTYGVAGAGWVALDMENRLIAFGAKTPSAKEFEGMLGRHGLRSPAQRLRAFLRENPGHLDARADLLKDARRRAVARMPPDAPDAEKDLDAAKDLTIWGTLAAEADAAFSGTWLGMDLGFFVPDKKQPERFSKLMKATFRRHIPSVEAAIREQPTDRSLWNIWAWMARGLADYRWGTFIDSLGAFAYHEWGLLCPPAEVCIWLIEDSMAKKDWGSVVRFARIAGSFRGYYEDDDTEWSPRWGGGTSQTFVAVKGSPEKTIHLPQIEALLRLGMVEEANGIFDEMIRCATDDGDARANARSAAETARSIGMKNVAKVWEHGQTIDRTPYLKASYPRSAYLVVFADNGSELGRAFSECIGEALEKVADGSIVGMFIDPQYSHDRMLDWKVEDGPRWGLFARDGRLLAEGREAMDADDMRALFKKHGTGDPVELLREHVKANSGQTAMEFHLARYLLWQIAKYTNYGRGTAPSDVPRIDAAMGEMVKCLGRALADCPRMLFNFGDFFQVENEAFRQSPSMQSLAKPYLAAIESLLEIKPSAGGLWEQWFFWRAVENQGNQGGDRRSLVPVLDRVRPSPLARPGTIPTGSVLNKYYEECKKNGDWRRLIVLLKGAWDREIPWFINRETHKWPEHLWHELGDKVGAPLMEAYLNDGRPHDADEVFNAWLDCGGSFADIAALAELAVSKGEAGLADAWRRRQADSSR